MLVPDGSSPEARRVGAALGAAGHRVHHCVDATSPYVCVAVRGGPCPLDTAPVSVTVCAAGPRPDDPSLAQEGAACSVRRSIPLVILDEAGDSPFAPYARSVRGGEDMLSVVLDVASSPLGAASGRATEALRRELGREGLEAGEARAEVRRNPDGGLVVDLAMGADVAAPTARTIAVRLGGLVRTLDRGAGYVDVRLAPSGASLRPTGPRNHPAPPPAGVTSLWHRRRRRRRP